MQDKHYYADAPIDELYAWFAQEAAPTSPAWEKVSLWVAATPDVAQLLGSLPGAKRQPNLFFGALRYLGAPTEPGPELQGWIHREWDRLRSVIMARETQTNEVGRAAVLAPVLGQVEGPISLLEVGCSAGLLLLVDRYAYRYTGSEDYTVGHGSPTIECTYAGSPPSRRLPSIAVRAGLDRSPLDPHDPDDARWLRSLVWPDEQAREARLKAAIATSRDVRTHLIHGDAVEKLPELLACAAPNTTRVVMHSALMAYMSESERERFEAAIRASGAHWLALEGDKVLPDISAGLPNRRDEPSFVIGWDGRPVGRCQPHGAWVEWAT